MFTGGDVVAFRLCSSSAAVTKGFLQLTATLSVTWTLNATHLAADVTTESNEWCVQVFIAPRSGAPG